MTSWPSPAPSSLLRLNVLLVVVGLPLLSVLVEGNKGTTDRFLLYEVNPGEGFNLRRDVFMRMAVFARNFGLQSEYNFTLVLPPWGRLYHWQSRDLGVQSQIPWKLFFDLDSLNRFTAVMDLQDFIRQHGHVLDAVFYLQNFKEGWTSGNFEEKMAFRDCIEPQRYFLDDESQLFKGPFWDHGLIRARNFSCISVQGSTKVMRAFIEQEAESKEIIMLDRAETLLHEHFGNVDYWAVRRSMRFAKHLVQAADEFRSRYLNSTDSKDGTVIPDRWEDHRPVARQAKGGPYLAVHFRRHDYLHSRPDRVPSISWAAEQIKRKLVKLQLTTVFVATDGTDGEFQQLREHLQPDIRVERFRPPKEVRSRLKDGGVAIIDQIICSHARYFLGSYESTFSFRIQEEREILGFSTESTFNILCPDFKLNCERGSVWKIVYPSKSDIGVDNKTEL